MYKFLLFSHISNTRLICIIYTEFKILNTIKPNNLINKWVDNINKHLTIKPTNAKNISNTVEQPW